MEISTGADREAVGQSSLPAPESASSMALRDVAGSLMLGVAVAVSNPILDLLSRNLAFFTAHQTVPLDVLGLVLLLTIVLPLVVALPVVILMRLAPGVGPVIYGIVLGLLVAAATLPFIERLIDTTWLVVAVAIGLGGLAVVACLRFRTLQTLLRWGALVPVFVLASFVFASPASGLIRAPDTVLQETSGVGNPIPVVVLVFDELPIQSLMNGEGNIDSTRFPGFASLLDDFTWFRNTATMHHYTEQVLPMIITGIPYQEDLEPTSVGYPNNLFTMLDSSHDVWAHEELTDFCGPEICREQQHPSALERWRLLLNDTRVVAAHVVLPAGATGWLPPLDGAWTGFGQGEPTPDAPEATQTEGEAAVYDEFLDSLNSVGPHSLRFMHNLDPHFPWHALPGGLRYAGVVRTNGKGLWDDDQQVVDLAHQSHMLQTGYVDGQLVRFLDMIRNTSWYDEALVMVMADHGISFKANGYIRAGSEDNIDDIAYVPLFVKTPGQCEGRIDDHPANLFDVLPTIIDVLEVDSTWPLEGESCLSSRTRRFSPPSVRRCHENRTADEPVFQDGIARKAELFGSGSGWDSVYTLRPISRSRRSGGRDSEPGHRVR